MLALAAVGATVTGCEEYGVPGLSYLGIGAYGYGASDLYGAVDPYVAWDPETSDRIAQGWVDAIGGYYDGGEWDQSGVSGDGEW